MKGRKLNMTPGTDEIGSNSPLTALGHPRRDAPAVRHAGQSSVTATHGAPWGWGSAPESGAIAERELSENGDRVSWLRRARSVAMAL